MREAGRADKGDARACEPDHPRAPDRSRGTHRRDPHRPAPHERRDRPAPRRRSACSSGSSCSSPSRRSCRRRAVLRVFTSALALAFGVYACRRNATSSASTRLHRDECSIHLTVADSILRSGALRTDRELLDLRTAVELGAARLAAGLADVVPADCAARPARRSVGRDAARGGVRPRRRRSLARPVGRARGAPTRTSRSGTARATGAR